MSDKDLRDAASENFANKVYEDILDKIFLPAAAGETVTEYFKRLGIDPKNPPTEFIRVLERVSLASVQLSQVNVWIIAMRFAAILFAMRNEDAGKRTIQELASTMPEFPLEALFDQEPTQYAKDVLHPDSAESKAFEKIDKLLESRFAHQRNAQLTASSASVGGMIAPERNKPYRQIMHITCGDETWTPSAKELRDVVSQFMAATFGVNGGIVATRSGVHTNIIETNIDSSDMQIAIAANSIEDEGLKHAFTTSAGTIPSEGVPLQGHDLVKHLWNLAQHVQGPKSFAIDETGFFTVDAYGNRFPMYVASPLPRDSDDGSLSDGINVKG